MRGAWLLIVVACGGKSETSSEPLGVLRDTSKAWTYEIVSGEAVDALAPVAGAPKVKCKIKKREDEKNQTSIDCNPIARVDDPNDFGGALYMSKFLVFDKYGVHELVGPGPPRKGQALAFTFPPSLEGPSWTYDRSDELEMSSKIEVRSTTMNVVGKERTVWVASSTYTYSKDDPPRLGIAMFAPGFAPVLLCEREREGTKYWCLRITGLADGKKKPRPKLVAKLPSKQQRDDLVKLLTTMDHVPDLYYDRMHGKLAVRDDVPITIGHYAPMIEVEPTALRLDGKPVEISALAEQLSPMNARIAEEIAKGRLPRSEDPTNMLERINVLVDASTPWQRVRDVVDATAIAGFRQPQFVFSRTPSTPPPPPTWVEGAVKDAALDNESGDFLAKLFKEILAGCEPLREAFALSDASGIPMSDQLIKQLAERIPTSSCMYDLPALRSALWVALGTPYPHSVVGIEIDPKGERIELPAATPWREANAKLKAGVPVFLTAR